MYNRELQSIDNQEKAYLLGLFYADGNVGLNQMFIWIERKVNLTKFYLQISLYKKALFLVNFAILMIQFVMVIIIIK